MIVFLCLLALAAAKPQVHESTDGAHAELLHSNDFIPQQDINPEHKIQQPTDHVIQPRSCFPIYSCDNANTINPEDIPRQSFDYDITNLKQAQNSPVNMLQHFQTVHHHLNPIQQIQQQCLQQHQIEVLQKQYQNQQLLLKKQYETALNQALSQTIPQTCVQTGYIPPPKILSSTQWSSPLPNIDIMNSMNSGVMNKVDSGPTGGVNTEFIPGTSFNLGSCQVTPLYAITCVGSA